ncbi:MAG: hypothetical protein ACI97N_002244, partial [Cognaticolwellia sp.]
VLYSISYNLVIDSEIGNRIILNFAKETEPVKS